MKIAFRGDRIAFVAQRRSAQRDLIKALEPLVEQGLTNKRDGSDTWWRPVVDASHNLWNGIVRDDGGDPAKSLGDWARVALDMAHSLTKTKTIDEHSAEVIATFLAGMILDSATIAAAEQGDEQFEIEWVSMHDTKVRHTHKIADGQTIARGEKFMVGGSQMAYPHDTTAPIKEWINCRCTVAPVPVHEKTAAAVDTDRAPRGVSMNVRTLNARAQMQWQAHLSAITAANEMDRVGLVPWHGVLAPEGVWSGDRRRFANDSLSHRPLPLPLTWQEKAAPGHDDAEVVASIDWMEKRGNLMHGGGYMLQTPAADKFVGLMAHFGKFGVSVDADDAEMDLVEDGEDEGVTFSKARICSASGVPIPAFAEAYVSLGEDPDHVYGDGSTDDTEAIAAALDQMASTFILPPATTTGTTGTLIFNNKVTPITCTIEELTDAEEGDLCLEDGCPNAPTKAVSTDNPNVWGCFCDEHAAAHEDQPLEWASGREDFGRGPGWITNPADTKRIHDYWTKPGEPGYAKVGWGTPGDFNRCRAEVGEEIAEEDPAKAAKFINQICAQWHKDATGFWPGHAPTEGGSLETPEGEPAPAVTIVASAATVAPPGKWFVDPGLTGPTPVQFVEEDGMTHIFGHVNLEGLCHMGFNTGECVNPGKSANDYAYYRCGEVMTTEGPVPTGPVTVGTGHAEYHLGMRPALAHYDNTGTAVADVAAGDDEHGTWINGWVRPWASDEQKYELRAHPPSGDWRRNPNTGDLDMIAVLSVNAPGLPVRRIGYSNGQQVSLVAAAVVAPEVEEDVVGDLAEQIAARLEDRAQRREAVAALASEFEEGD